MKAVTLTVSLADQRFDQSKSLGIFNVSLGLCRALARDPAIGRLTLLANSTLPNIGPPDSGRVVVAETAGGAGGRVWRLWWDQFGAYRAARRAGNEWLLLPKGYASFLGRCPVNLATYVHDVTQEFYREHYPRGFPRFENVYFHAGLRAAIARSQVVLANTRFTAAEIRRVADRYRLPVPRIECVGIGFERPRPAASAPRTRIMVLASRWPHKRTDLAVAYLSRWQAEQRFSGPIDWVGQLPAGVVLPAQANWRLHSRLAPEEFNRLLAEARAQVYFSEYEGFGMPPVESALAGACPVYSDIPSTREVMEDAGCRFTNTDYASFVAALDEALRAPESRVAQWSEQLLARHHWPAVAERTLRALQ